MSFNPGRRQRQKLRELALAKARLEAIRASTVPSPINLPKREMRLLAGLGKERSNPYNPDVLKGLTHYAGCSANAGITGQGDAAKAKAKALARFSKPRWAHGFMALPYQGMGLGDTQGPADDKDLIKLPPSKRFKVNTHK